LAAAKDSVPESEVMVAFKGAVSLFLTVAVSTTFPSTHLVCAVALAFGFELGVSVGTVSGDPRRTGAMVTLLILGAQAVPLPSTIGAESVVRLTGIIRSQKLSQDYG
jgi:ABC-type antimicrobial peptide transport system permease subunit